MNDPSLHKLALLAIQGPVNVHEFCFTENSDPDPKPAGVMDILSAISYAIDYCAKNPDRGCVMLTREKDTIGLPDIHPETVALPECMQMLTVRICRLAEDAEGTEIILAYFEEEPLQVQMLEAICLFMGLAATDMRMYITIRGTPLPTVRH